MEYVLDVAEGRGVGRQGRHVDLQHLAPGLVLVLSVDWFIGMARAVGNLIGNCVATVVVAAWEGDLDRATAAKVLDGGEMVDVTAG